MAFPESFPVRLPSLTPLLLSDSVSSLSFPLPLCLLESIAKLALRPPLESFLVPGPFSFFRNSTDVLFNSLSRLVFQFPVKTLFPLSASGRCCSFLSLNHLGFSRPFSRVPFHPTPITPLCRASFVNGALNRTGVLLVSIHFALNIYP